MKWAFIITAFFMFFTAEAQHLRATHPSTLVSVEYPIGAKVFFKKKASKTIRYGTIQAFRNDSIVLNTDSFPIDHLLHISPQRLIGQLGFGLLSGYELFGTFVQFGAGGGFYIGATTDQYISEHPLKDVFIITAILYTSGSFIRLQGRFLKNMKYALRRKRSFEIVLD